MERRLHHSLDELLQQDRYPPEEVAELLWAGVDVVRHAAFTGELRVQIIEHDIISFKRDDVLAWLREIDVRGGGPPVPVVGGKGTDYGT
jgi:hypothetical protein